MSSRMRKRRLSLVFRSLAIAAGAAFAMAISATTSKIGQRPDDRTLVRGSGLGVHQAAYSSRLLPVKPRSQRLAAAKRKRAAENRSLAAIIFKPVPTRVSMLAIWIDGSASKGGF